MTCFHPIECWLCSNPGDETKTVLFNHLKCRRFEYVKKIQVPCGQCVGCRNDRAKDWAVRCMHEAQMHNQNCFITLTYNDSNMPDNFGIDIKWIQDFNKRLRKRFASKKIRTFYCAEYGDEPVLEGSPLGRPHFHEIVFGIDFPDKYLWSMSKKGCPIYRSPILEKLWPYGYSTIQDVNYASARYCARYSLKKITGKLADEHYMDPRTGEIRNPECVHASNRPGIGHDWLEKYKGDVYPSDYVVLENEFRSRPPRYYDKLFDVIAHEELNDIKDARESRALERSFENTPERLAVKEELLRSRLRELERN